MPGLGPSRGWESTRSIRAGWPTPSIAVARRCTAVRCKCVRPYPKLPEARARIGHGSPAAVCRCVALVGDCRMIDQTRIDGNLKPVGRARRTALREFTGIRALRAQLIPDCLWPTAPLIRCCRPEPIVGGNRETPMSVRFRRFQILVGVVGAWSRRPALGARAGAGPSRIGDGFALLAALMAPALPVGQTPPDIMVDRFLLKAEQSVRDRDFTIARAAMEWILSLQEEHGLEPPAEDHFRYAKVWQASGAPERALESLFMQLEHIFIEPLRLHQGGVNPRHHSGSTSNPRSRSKNSRARPAPPTISGVARSMRLKCPAFGAVCSSMSLRSRSNT